MKVQAFVSEATWAEALPLTINIDAPSRLNVLQMNKIHKRHSQKS
jgi:hypothetical protein